ncbi:Serine/threonine-protein kinase ppk23 [Pleurostoma richardsiae]|uniref:cyclin-dependent kinase n=1 Tax=Pleurostoma richardsiae TaxID=41990 RepID=A0AA38S9L3_9PEZI|nr:Serine/threonine-protein kinase ppk23 [Pleurostoma richardsiae]
MASKGKSRWADSEEDAALEARLKREKEEKKRLKAERARKLEEERRVREAQAAAVRQAEAAGHDAHDDDGPPTKRRKLTPEREDKGSGEGSAPGPEGTAEGRRLLRFEGGQFGKSRSVENYEKLNDIEEGAYGWVSRAKEAATGRVVALKRLKIEPKDRGGLPVTGLREIQILKDCEHKNVVKLREVVVGEDTRRIENIFLVLEFVEHDLKSILEDMPEPFLASEVKTLLLQLASGVAYLHDNWILHRDLKTSNLLLNNRGQLKIADFGMARYVGDPPPKLTQLVVTLWYRAPELLLGAARYGQPVDMWSVGCIFGELLTREPLLQGKNEVDELTRIFELCGIPTEETWPGFRRLPNARSLRLPKSGLTTGSVIRARFPLLTAAGSALLNGLLALDPARRPTAREMLAHEYFKQDPKPKQEAMFPTFPSKAGQERRRRRQTPNAPVRGEAAVEMGAVDFSGIFSGREKEEKGGGFSLRMI